MRPPRARRVAALYDIHGNAAALDAVLEEINLEGIEQIVIGGDVVWGPFPSEVLRRLRAIDALWVRGNTDRDVAAGADRGVTPADWIEEMDTWCAEQLTPQERGFLRDLPRNVAVSVDGFGDVLFCHATPRSEDEIITAITPDEDVTAVLEGVQEELIVCGHTHSQFDRTVGTKRVVNAGSVGLPYEDSAGAYWTILGPDVTSRRTHYDTAAAAARVRDAGCPAAEWFAEVLDAPMPRDQATRDFEARRARRFSRPR